MKIHPPPHQTEEASGVNSNPTPPATTENDIQTSQATLCPHFLNGHCSQKRNCLYNHNVSTCELGRKCPNKSTSCLLRHPKICKNFQDKKCGFINSRGVWINYKNCSHLHQALIPHPLAHEPSLGPTDNHEVAEVLNSDLEKLQNDLSKASLKIESLEKSIHQLREDLKQKETENLDQQLQHLLACLFKNHQNNKVVNNETHSLDNTAEPGMQIMNKEEPERVHTVDSEVSGSANSQTVTSGGIAEAERWVGNENKEPESVNTVDSEVSSPANSKAFSSTDTAEDEMLWVKEEQPQRVTWSLKSHNNYSVLDKVMNVLNKGSFPTGAAPKKKESKVGPKDKTSTEVSEVETEMVQVTSDSTPAQPFTIYDNCRTNLYLDYQSTTNSALLQSIS